MGRALRLQADSVVVGAGIVGLATAAQLARRGRVIVIDKEPAIAAHQTGHNSGVIHSGIYYRPGSLKARTAAAGRRLLLELCRDRGIAHKISGKVIVATTGEELSRLGELRQRGQANGLQVERVGPERLAEIEPHVRGLGALLVPETGVVDFARVAMVLAEDVESRGGEVRLGEEVLGISARPGEVVVTTTGGDVRAEVLVNCAGLQSDRVAAMTGASRSAGGAPMAGVRIMPFRGEYRELVPTAAAMVRTMIYPLPDPSFPFLGVHLTRGIDGRVHVGPNAVPALAREGYRWRDIDRRDVLEIVGSRGTWHLAGRYWRTGLAEMWRSVSERAFLRALRRLVPGIGADDLVPAPAGVRAQAMDARGRLLDDFVLVADGRVVHVVNAPSPAATASLAIAREIVACLP